MELIQISWRAVRKFWEFPASTDVGELATMITKLRKAVERQFGRKIAGAASTIPHLQAATLDDLRDAFDHVGLIHIPSYPYRWEFEGYFPEAGAVYAGSGLGICSNYTDIEECKQEGKRRGMEDVLAISYTGDVLSSVWTFESLSFAYSDHESYVLANPRLGWNYRHLYASEDDYWDKVRSSIIAPLVARRQYYNDTAKKVLGSGECVGESKFQEILKKAISEILPAEVPIFRIETLYAGAGGAAEFAKQAVYRYKKTGRCCQAYTGGKTWNHFAMALICPIQMPANEKTILYNPIWTMLIVKMLSYTSKLRVSYVTMSKDACPFHSTLNPIALRSFDFN